jgi:transcriptional regulator with XRE-family HTH domain
MTKTNNSIFIAEGLSEGDKIRFTRLSKHLRQIDVASMAHVQVFEVTAIEKGRHLRKSSRIAILQVLELATTQEIEYLNDFTRQINQQDDAGGDDNL